LKITMHPTGVVVPNEVGEKIHDVFPVDEAVNYFLPLTTNNVQVVFFGDILDESFTVNRIEVNGYPLDEETINDIIKVLKINYKKGE